MIYLNSAGRARLTTRCVVMEGRSPASLLSKAHRMEVGYVMG